MVETSGKSRPTPREVLIAAAHVAALWALAFAQPLLDLLGSNPEFFVARGNTSIDIIILALGITLGPALGLAALLVLAALVGRAAFTVAYLGLLAILAAFFAVQLLERFFGFDSLPAVVTTVVALGLGAALAWGVRRGRFLRAVLDVLSVAPLVVLALFFFASDSSRLILPQDEAKALGGTVGGDVPVVVLIFDELPASTLLKADGGIDGRRFPGFATLARESTWFPNATTVADFTGRAVPAILTGMYPDGSKLPIAADQPRNIFTLLGGTYDLHVRESVTRLCPQSLCEQEDSEQQGLTTRLRALASDLRYVEGRLVLPSDWAERLPQVSTNFGGFGDVADQPAHKRAGQFVRDMFRPPSPSELATFLDEIPEGRRTLSLIHMELPHEPFRYLPDGRAYNDTSLSILAGPGGQKWASGAVGIATVQQRHYLQTGYADTLIQTMISRLKKLDLWQQAMVVVTADHGISFKPGVPRRIATSENLAGVANPPLFIKYPGRVDGAVERRHVRTIDIVPTIAAEVGVRDPYEMDGEAIPAPPEERQAESPDGAEEGSSAAEAPIVVFNGQGEEIRATLPELISQREEILRQADRMLGDRGLFRLGPRPNLVGLEAPPFIPPPPAGPQAELSAPGLFLDVDLQAEPLPLFVTGSLEGVEPSTVIAIAVNGRIAATTRAFQYDGALRFGAVVRPQDLVPGNNEVSVYMLTASGDLAALATP